MMEMTTAVGMLGFMRGVKRYLPLQEATLIFSPLMAHSLHSKESVMLSCQRVKSFLKEGFDSGYMQD